MVTTYQRRTLCCGPLQSVLRYLLPPLVLQADPTSSRLLRALVIDMQTVHRDLLMTNFKHIFSYLVCNASGHRLAAALSFLEVSMANL